jgi:hypothetical protein
VIILSIRSTYTEIKAQVLKDALLEGENSSKANYSYEELMDKSDKEYDCPYGILVNQSQHAGQLSEKVYQVPACFL